MKERDGETRDMQSLEVGEILDRLRVSAVAAFGEERVAEASVREALEASARAVWLVGSEPLDPMEMEPHRHD